jgi:diphthamide synthase (EF-2-diphthine--ammonia ligase)
MEKPSCIRELKQLAHSLTSNDTETAKCIAKVKEILNCGDLSSTEKITKLKEICEEYGK